MTRAKIMAMVLALFLLAASPLSAQKTALAPPPPEGGAAAPLYEYGKALSLAFPKYFNFLADGRGLGGTGAVRITVKTTDPETGKLNDILYEVREVGEILATDEHGGLIYGDSAEKALTAGRTLMSTNDEVMVRFTEDLAKILDAETYGDYDPYFREFPIYGVGETAREGSAGRVDRFSSVGEMYRYKGRLTVVARVEGLAPLSWRQAAALKRGWRGSKNQDAEPVAYVARITYSEDAVEVNDRVFLFHPLEPGPERFLSPPFVEPAGTYNSQGN